MMDEHCERRLGCDVEFTTDNYKITTSPKKEYCIAIGEIVCPESEMKDSDGTSVRKIRSVSELKNLELAASLAEIEILAVVSCCD